MVNIVTSGIISCSFLILVVVGQQMLGIGKWTVLYVQPCAEDAEMPWRVRLRKHRVNRTHDAYDAELSLGALLDDSYDVRGQICRKVDGGCKPFGGGMEKCLPCITRKHAAANMAKVLTALGVDPPDFPVAAGEYSAVNYLLDTDDLVSESVYGEYVGQGYIVKDGRDMACLEGSVKYEPRDDYGSVDDYLPMSPFS